MRLKRILNANDLPSNAAELFAAAKREACDNANIPPEAFDVTPSARLFAAAMLAYVPTGAHPRCLRSMLGVLRANAIVGRRATDSSVISELRQHHPGWNGLAFRKAQKLMAVWDADARQNAEGDRLRDERR